MRVVRLLAWGAIAVALAVGATACGDETTTTGQTTATRKASEVAWRDAPPPPALADVGQRLREAGYAVALSERKQSEPWMRVEMRAGGWTFVGRPRRPISRRQADASLKTTKGRIAARVAGGNVYVASVGADILSGIKKRALSDAQLAEFAEVVAAGSGGEND
jgi:hypothetical protein